jgi:hypothetical protein
MVLTRTSQKLYLSSNLTYGFRPRPSLSTSFAHSLQETGFSFSAPRTNPVETIRSDTRASTTMSFGREVEDEV